MSEIPWSVVMDPQRLCELEELHILDTSPEQSYDDLAGLARVICDAPVANITMVAQNRQWFKSRVGSETTETAIEHSVCAHAIGEPSDLIINDLRNDPRTRDNLLVTGEASLRFYAGVPLRLNAGFGVGTLCVLDTKPHPAGLSRVQRDALRTLGRQITILLQIRKFLARHSRSDVGDLEPANALQHVSEHLISAYNANKLIDDGLLEVLLNTSLLHVGRRIAENERL